FLEYFTSPSASGKGGEEKPRNMTDRSRGKRIPYRRSSFIDYFKERLMEDIIAGRFETDDEAKSAAASLSDFTSKDDIFIFFNNQPGAHDSDRSEAETDDRGAAKGAASGATTGAVAAGTVGTVVGGPGVGAVAAAVGGYTGSL